MIKFTICNAAASPVRDEKGLGRGVNPCTADPNPMLVPLGTAECAGMGEKSDAPNGAKDGGWWHTGVPRHSASPLPKPGPPLTGF